VSDQIDPQHPEAIRRAIVEIVRKSDPVLDSPIADSRFQVRFAQSQLSSYQYQKPVRGQLFRGDGQLRYVEPIGSIDVTIRPDQDQRILDVTVELPLLSGIAPETTATGNQRDCFTREGHRWDPALREGIAKKVLEWGRKVGADKCIIRSEDVYLGHYVRRNGFSEVHDTHSLPVGGRSPYVAMASDKDFWLGYADLDEEVFDVLRRYDRLHVLADGSGHRRVGALATRTRSMAVDSARRFTTRHAAVGSRREQRVSWYVPDRDVSYVGNVRVATSAELVARAMIAVDRIGRVLGYRAIPKEVVFAPTQSRAVDVLAQTCYQSDQRTVSDGRLSSLRGRSFYVAEMAVRVPTAFHLHARYAEEVRDGLRLPTVLLPIEEIVATLGWRAHLGSEREVGVNARNTIKDLTRRLIGDENFALLDRPSEQPDTDYEARKRSELACAIGSHRASRSLDALSAQLFCNWLSNPFPTTQAQQFGESLALVDPVDALGL
jgi:hypothetical protein